MKIISETKDGGVIVQMTKKEWTSAKQNNGFEFEGLGQRLKMWREQYGVSLREAEKVCGVTFSVLCRIENGRETTVSTANAIIKMLDNYLPYKVH